jgi:hypothetical protein
MQHAASRSYYWDMSRAERMHQRNLAVALRERGQTWIEIAAELQRQWPDLNPRSAMRIAHGWTQREAANAWNRQWPNQPKADRDVGIWELRRPGLPTLSKLARVYECAVSDLLDDIGNYRHLDLAAEDRAETSDQFDADQLADLPTRWDDGAAKRVDELLTVADQGIQPVNQVVSRIIYQWLIVPPPQRVHLEAGRRVGGSLVGQAHQRAAQLSRLDDFIGGRDSRQLVERELAATLDLVCNGSYDDAVGRELLSATATLAWLAGWVAADAGCDDDAVARYGTGIRAAHAAGDRLAAANLVSSFGQHLTNQGDLRGGIDAARAAVAGMAGTKSPAVSALIVLRAAWAHANAGDVEMTLTALDQADDDFDCLGTFDDPGWAYWLDRNEIDVLRARCMIRLGQPGKAVPLLSDVLDRYDPYRGRELALHTAWLADAQAEVGELDEAAARAIRAVELASGSASARAEDRVRLLRVKLAPHASSPAIRDFLEAAQGL